MNRHPEIGRMAGAVLGLLVAGAPAWCGAGMRPFQPATKRVTVPVQYPSLPPPQNVAAALLPVDLPLDGLVRYFPRGGIDCDGQRFSWWARMGGRVVRNDAAYFPGFWQTNDRIIAMLQSIGVGTAPVCSGEDIWARAAAVWVWLRDHARPGPSYGYGSPDRWPSLDEMAAMYERFGTVPWYACFSRAHLFATLLGSVGIPADHVAIASAHYPYDNENGYAQHTYVALRVDRRWYYLDPSYVNTLAELPPYGQRASYGLRAGCQYSYPYEAVVLPGSSLDTVPMLYAAPPAP
ncbi:MAG TPA: hypothetical protein P5567_02610 [Kiritimatiellia bacterium]|nr:hypothetical protein [Kiritimatiellia bacterium]HRZ11324.1 hypothetical protein [Kiritimatiellia bacterium]HSA17125.1 hypothetical protein [Kiritimatiellia bacterium]